MTLKSNLSSLSSGFSDRIDLSSDRDGFTDPILDRFFLICPSLFLKKEHLRKMLFTVKTQKILQQIIHLKSQNHALFPSQNDKEMKKLH